jgi:hypothetical protein
MNIYVVLSAFASRPASLRANNKASVFFSLVVFMLSPSKLASAAWSGVGLMCPFQFQTVLLFVSLPNGILK